MKREYDYTQIVKLNHNEVASKINIETGEVTEIKQRVNNIPSGKSKLDYERFYIKNENFTKICKNLKLLTYEELGIVDYMCSISEFNTNSLSPLSDETTNIYLAETFDIPRHRIPKIMKKLFTLGVYLQLKYFSASLHKEVNCWVLNPNISWKGKLKDDSMFEHFKDTTISKLLNK
jgi:hypothetical protein